jgi:hypothetical protein
MATDDHVMVATAAATVTAPWAGRGIGVLVDGAVLEVNTAGSLIGLPVPAAADLAPAAGDISSWWPSRP